MHRAAGMMIGVAVLLGTAAPAWGQSKAASDTFSLEAVLGYAYPLELTAADSAGTIAWVVDQRGRRNVWVARAPDFAPHQITGYTADDGQELSELSLTPDGKTAVYVRGGDHDGNWGSGTEPDPTSSPIEPKRQIWAVSTDSGAPKLLADGDDPVIAPDGGPIVFGKGGQIWTRSLADTLPAKQLFYARGDIGSVTFSPDGSRLAFVADRGDHSFVGVFVNDSTPITWLAPSTSHDFMPVWSPDGKTMAFVRMAGSGGAPRPLLENVPRPWAIWIADVATGAGHQVWQSPATDYGSYPTTDGNANLHWAAGDRLTFLADLDGWPHLYSLSTKGGEPLLLTPGRFMVEHISLSPDRRTLVYAANTGPDSSDSERRHVFRVSVDHAGPTILTPGSGIEWSPILLNGERTVAFIGAGSAVPPEADDGAGEPAAPCIH